MNKKNKEKSFWAKFSRIHLYDTKGEAIFKAIAITISWIGGVFFTEIPQHITREIGIAFYLFALALIMEYIVKVVVSHHFIQKIIPFVISTLNVLLFFATVAVLFERPIPGVEYVDFYKCTQLSLVIIWFDVILQILIEPANKENVENGLKNI